MLNRYFSRDDVHKIIYEDGGNSKTIRGQIIDEEEFLYVVKATVSEDIVIIGKRAVIKVSVIKESGENFG